MSEARDINGGFFVGVYDNGGTANGYVTDDSDIFLFEDLGTFLPEDLEGDFIAGASNGIAGVLDRGNGNAIENIGVLSGDVFSNALGLSSSLGDIAVGFSEDGLGAMRPFLWTETDGLFDLNSISSLPSGFSTLFLAEDVENGFDNILVYGDGGGGVAIHTEIVPKPSSMLLAALGAVCLHGYGCRRRKRIACLLAFAAATLAHTTAVRAQAYFTGLGDLPGATFHSVAYGISADGNVAFGNSRGKNENEAVRWSLILKGLGGLRPGNFASRVEGSTPHGRILVGTGRNSCDQSEALLFWSGHKPIVLPRLDSMSTSPQAQAASIDGTGQTIVGESRGETHIEPVHWHRREQGNWRVERLLRPTVIPKIQSGKATAVTRNGLLAVGILFNASVPHAVAWTRSAPNISFGVAIALRSPEDDLRGEANEVSSDGVAIVGQCLDGNQRVAGVWLNRGGSLNWQHV